MIVCRSASELERMRDAGRLVAEVLTELAAHVAPGVTTADLDALGARKINACYTCHIPFSPAPVGLVYPTYPCRCLCF